MKSNERTGLTHTFAPVADKDCKILILGTFPSVKSRQNSFYYGNPHNRFWRVTAGVLNSRTACTIEDKKDFLLKHHIALWDVIHSCTIQGSSDSSIRDVVPNDISHLLKTTNIQKIYTNGTTAKKLYDKYIFPVCGVSASVLPSTSPANAACNMDKLLEKWAQIKDFL